MLYSGIDSHGIKKFVSALSPGGVQSDSASICNDMLVWSIPAKEIAPSRPKGLWDRFRSLSVVSGQDDMPLHCQCCNYSCSKSPVTCYCVLV